MSKELQATGVPSQDERVQETDIWHEAVHPCIEASCLVYNHAWQHSNYPPWQLFLGIFPSTGFV
jgi:hypothetical protein